MYTVEILDSTLSPVTKVSTLAPLNAQGDFVQYTSKLSDWGTAKFRVSTKDPLFKLVGDILQPYANHVRIWRGTVVVWQGIIVNNPHRTKRYIEVEARTYLYLLSKTLIVHDPADGNGAEDYRTFSSGTMADAIAKILSETKTIVGSSNILSNLVTGTVSNPNFPANFTDPSNPSASWAGLPWTFSSTFQLKFDWRDILYIIQSFGIYAAYDFELVPATGNVTTNASVTVTNYITNPSFEVDLSGWTSTNATTVRRTSLPSPYSGSGYANFQTTTTTGYFTMPVNLVAGTTYTLSNYSSVAGGAVAPDPGTSYLGFFTTASGVAPTTSVQQNVNSWARNSVTFTPSVSGTYYVGVYGYQQDSTIGNAAIMLDAFQLEVGNTASTYFDGSIGGASWTGTANASTSTKTVTVSTTTPTTTLTFNFKQFIGNKQPELEFSYGPYGSIEDYDIPLDGAGMINDFIGIAADTNYKIIFAPGQDDASVKKYGKLQGVSAYADAKNLNTIRARIAEELIYTSTPDSEIRLSLNDKAYPLGQYGLGDLVTIDIQDHIISERAERRIVGIEVDVNQNGKETITLTTNFPRPS